MKRRSTQTWRWTISTLALSALCLIWTGLAFAQGGGFLCNGSEVEVLEQTLDRTVIRIAWPPELNLTNTSAYDFAIATPTDQAIVANILELDAAPIVPEIDVPVGELFRSEGPMQAREMWIQMLRVSAVYRAATGVQMGVSEVVLEISHPVSPAMAALGRDVSFAPSDPNRLNLYEGVVVNPKAARRIEEIQRRMARMRALPIVEDTFARSTSWLRLEVDETQLYVLDYPTLRAAMGSAIDAVDPTSIRLFGAGSRVQPELPEQIGGSWQSDQALVERPIRVVAAGSTFAPGDMVYAYLPGAEGWADEFDASAGWLEHQDHQYATRIAYWLTWDGGVGAPGDFPAAPLRMQERDATPTASPDVVRRDGRVRSHFERNAVPAFGLLQDNWAWKTLIPSGGRTTLRFDLEGVVTDSVSWFHTEARAARLGSTQWNYVARYSLNSVLLDQFTWNQNEQQSSFVAPVMFHKSGAPIREGSNVLLVEHDSAEDTSGRSPQLMVDAVDLTWRRSLALGSSGALGFTIPDAESTTGRWRFDVQESQGGLSTAVVLDVTDAWNPVILNPQSGRLSDVQMHFEQDLVAGARRDFLLMGEASIPRPLRVVQGRPRLLKQELVTVGGVGVLGWDMIILHPSSFRSAALELRDLRQRDLAGVSGARVTAVDLQDVYDQFGHGTKDVGAIRNYLKFVYGLDQRLLYVVLLGDANRDAKSVLPATDPDLCPTRVANYWPRPLDTNTAPFADDDWFVRFQDPLQIRSEVAIELPDAAIGRLPASTVAQAETLVERITKYVEDPAMGPWRNTLLIAADDEFGAAQKVWSEYYHIAEAECLSEFVLPRAIDVDKLYLTEYPRPGADRAKPAARLALSNSWSEGRVIVHYIGHGSPEQLADENLFRIEDVSSLENGDRLPLFLAFSCDVSIFDDPTKTSMAEAMVLRDTGGAIATIAATQVTYVGLNNDLTESFYSQLFLEPGQLQQTSRTVASSSPLGLALMQSKWRGPDIYRGALRLPNDAKYVLLGDPALQLATPDESVQLSGDLAAAITAGQRSTITGDLQSPSASGRWFLQAKESADSTSYEMIRPPTTPGGDPTSFGFINYVLDGSTFYEGRGDFSAGAFSAELRTPTVMNFGDQGRVRVLMEDGDSQYVGLVEGLDVAAGTVDSDDRVGPKITMRFANDARKVQPGSVLEVAIEDTSGVNVLGTTPANSILLEFDSGGIGVDVTDRFELDENTFTRGTLDVTLPNDITMGEHSLKLSAADMVSNVSSSTMDFEVVPEGRTSLGAHAAFPNPFSISTRFVVEVLAPSGMRVELELDLYSLRGDELKTLRGHVDGGSGRLVLEWDGRDEFGDEIANGTYLYVVRAHFPTAPARTETATGRIVLMR